ncbi:MAG: DUF3987 domain-containing protein [Gammaproteobacteria bacterium]|nr:DUF3987 domain-containing protein [Gammaproteobacteria bacterium]
MKDAGFQLIEDTPQSAYDGLKTYNQRITEHLDATEYSRESGELNRHSLQFEPNAWRVWKVFHDECQIDVRPNGRYEDIKAFAMKAPEQAARIAGIITLMENSKAVEIPDSYMYYGVDLARFYLSEALRLVGLGAVNVDLERAQRLLTWIQNKWLPGEIKSSAKLPDSERFIVRIRTLISGARRICPDGRTAKRLLHLLCEHGYAAKTPDGWDVRNCAHNNDSIDSKPYESAM